MIADGSWSAAKIVGELGEVLAGAIPARENENETVVFESVGMSLWDSTATAWAYRWALERKVGTPFSLA
jgi:ornithine cyclodeaminase